MNIYVISNPNDGRNLVKVGQTKRSWAERETEYRTHGTNPQVWHIEYDTTLTDDDIKHVLINDLHYTTEGTVGDEWYVIPDGETEKDFANKVKAVIVSLKHNEPLDLLRTQDFDPRDEQKECVKKTLTAFNAGSDKFLWNCKMRFGKTFTTYQLMKQANFQNILVLTWKVAVEKGWKEDLLSHRDFKGINFVNKDALATFDKSKRNVVFLSIPLLLANTSKDAKAAEDSETEDDAAISDASINAFADKIKSIADMNWDLLVIDEAHYGTRAKNTKKILEKLKYKRKLELSGTPFKILDDAEYHSDEIYNWTYKQEQAAKYGWKGPKDQNPYKDLPDMHIYTFDGARELINDFSDTVFNINVLFKTHTEKDKNNKPDPTTATFVNLDSVKRMIDFMCGEQFDLTEDKDIKEYDVVLPYFQDMVDKNKKSIWFLPDVASVCAMEKLLNNHKIFKNYKIINASGAGEGSSAKSLDKFHELEQKTDKIICLSCGMLNTGVTIRPLNSVVMLQDKHSAQDFFQSIFRCQSPCPPDKSDCYVFDFNPQRYFNNMLEFSKVNSSKRNPREVLEENLIETHLYIDGNMIATKYDDIMQYVSFEVSPERLKKYFIRSNNIKVETLENSAKDILEIIDSIPYYKKETKTAEKTQKKTGNVKKKTGKKPPISPERKKASEYDIRKAKLDILISSLTIFIYITNAQESNVYEIITTKESDLFNKICFIGVEQFKKLYDYKDKNGRSFFKHDILDKAIAKFKNEEFVSRDWDEILRDEFGLPRVVATKKIVGNQFSFDEIGLKAGSELTFTLDPNKRCYVAPDLRNVTYQANLYSLSDLARILAKEKTGKDWEHRGPKYFEYRGVKLSKIVEDINAQLDS